MWVVLLLAACVHSAWAQCDDATATAESTCKADNSCTECSDFNFGDDCTSNKREHCAEIECCPTCESEIRSMFACEHGATCGVELTCEAAPPSPVVAPADSSRAERVILAGSATLLVSMLSSYASFASLG